MIDMFLHYGPIVLSVLGVLSVAAAALARMTANTSDDALVAKVTAFLDRLSGLFLKPKA